MNRLRLLLSLCISLFVLIAVDAQENPPVPAPTLVPPTPIPVVESAIQDVLLTESALVQIQSEQRVRIGILYNELPFGELNIRGEVAGFDAALGRSIAEAWGVTAEFVQVTRQTAQDKLLQGEVDLLLAAQVHYRHLDEQFEFSQTYYRGYQTLMVRLDDPAQSLADMNNRRIGVVMGTDAEQAALYWQQRTGATIAVQQYLMIDQAIVALVAGEVDGVIDKRYRLRTLINPDLTRVLDVVVQPEPYAAAFRRQDVNLRNLFNHTLQYLADSGRLAEIHNEYFPTRPYDNSTVPVWNNLGDASPQISTYLGEIAYPQQYAVPRVQSTGVLRVAGLPEEIPTDSEANRRFVQANLQLMQRFASRWGVTLQIVPNSLNDPIGFVERGEADIAVGVQPDWTQVNRVDFSTSYLLRGKRMMVQVRDDYTSFSELRGQWVGIFASEPGAADQVNELASSINSGVNIFTLVRDEDAAFEILVEGNVDVVYGDSIRLLPHLEANPDTLKLSERCAGCDPWYTREYYALAVPRNDIDFWLLVEYTLQEIEQDNSLQTILNPVTVPGTRLVLDVWPGTGNYFGFALR